MSKEQGFITDILPFSVNDGSGIRTTVFFKGCPLRCIWCHNPETWRREPQCMVNASLCVHCGRCAPCPNGARDEAGRWNAARCLSCGRCAAVCPTGATHICGRRTSVEAVLARVLPDRPFFRTRGGVTLSGGEPMAQPAFALALARAFAAQEVRVLVETCGQAPYEDYERILPFVDGFLFDWKETDPEKHRQFTGVDNARIRENLVRLAEAKTKLTLRCPIIPGYNDTQAHFEGIAHLARTLPAIQQVDLLPYHALGNSKRAQLAQPPDSILPPTPQQIAQWHQALTTLCPVPVHSA